MRPDLPRQEWHSFFDKLTNEYQHYDATIEIVDRDFGDQFETEKLPLEYLTYDHKDDAFIVTVGGRDSRYPVQLRHIIPHPKRILADTFTPDPLWAVDVFDADDVQTLVTLHRRPALPPPHSQRGG
jgi:hypothetical protein